MKFRRGFFNTIKSDAGFRVKSRTLQGFVEYREGPRRAIVPVEPVFSQAKVYLRKDTAVKWEPPYNNEIVPEDQRQQILHHIFEALRFNTCPIEWG